MAKGPARKQFNYLRGIEFSTLIGLAVIGVGLFLLVWQVWTHEPAAPREQGDYPAAQLVETPPDKVESFFGYVRLAADLLEVQVPEFHYQQHFENTRVALAEARLISSGERNKERAQYIVGYMTLGGLTLYSMEHNSPRAHDYDSRQRRLVKQTVLISDALRRSCDQFYAAEEPQP